MDKLKYSLLTNKDLPSAVDCVVKTFLYDEPMTKSLGITESEFKVFATVICKKCIREKLSYVCKNSQNKVIGFCLNEDLISDDSSSFDKVTKKMNPIFNILEMLDSSYLNDKQKIKNFFFHLFMVGSLSEYRNQGVAKKLIEKSLALAKKRKYKFVLTEATNLKSQNLLKKFNLEEVRKIEYSIFNFNGANIFKDIGEEYCKLMELKIP
jgi:ribosomal protein S18 acetylase RimI-like enzyme